MSRRVGTLLGDRRARVPFALIGLALLLISSMFVLQLETRDEPGPSREPDRALEQTEAATETALTDAVKAASKQAATEPMTKPAATPYGDVLARGDPFDRYLEALVYLEAQKRLDTAGQTIGSVETTVTLPEIEDRESFAAAVERVTIRAGSETDGIQAGVIEAEISGVQTVARRNGEVINQQTETVTVAVASPLYQLHDRTTTFQERLNAGLLKPGFTQRFNARIYALGWARGYAQHAGLPVTEVIANRHVVPSANDAIYRTQKDVFGAADPNLNNAVRRGWLCMAMHDAEGMYNSHTDGASDVSSRLCDASRWLFGDQATGEVPDAPGIMDLLGDAPGMDAEHTIGVNETSLLPIRELVAESGKQSIDDAINRIYEVRAGTDLDTEVIGRPEFSHNPPDVIGRGQVVETVTTEVDVTVVEITKPEPDDEYAAAEGTVDLEIEQTKEYTRLRDGKWETVRSTDTGTRVVRFTLTVEEWRRNPDAKIDEYNTAGSGGVPVAEKYVYESGPGGAQASTDRTIPVGDDGAFGNYNDPDQQVLAAVFEQRATDPDEGITEENQPADLSERVEHELTDRWVDAETADDLYFDEQTTVNMYSDSRALLTATIVADLRKIQTDVRDITHTFKRSEIIHDGGDTGPYGELLAKVRERKAAYLSRETPFANVGQKTVYEARYAYFEALERHLEQIEAAHGSAMSEIDEQLPDKGLEDAMRYLQQGVTAAPPEPVEMESSSLTDDITYEVSGSPTYLVTDTVTSESVPAVDNDATFAPMAAKNRNYLKLPYDSIVNGVLSKLGNTIGLTEPDAELTFQTASEALVAGEESIEAANADDEYGNTAELKRLNGAVESAVGASIAEYTNSVGAQIAFQLDTKNTTAPTDGYTKIAYSLVNCGNSDECFVKPDDCTANTCRMADGTTGPALRSTVEGAVAGAIEDYGDTAETVDGIASGAIASQITQEVAEAVDTELRPEYAEGMSEQEWKAIVRSATQHVVRDAAGEHGVTLSNADTVEKLDTEIRRTLEQVSKEIVKKRFDAAVGNESFDIENYDNWVDGTQTPVRVPAGLPILPVPGYWYATVNAWNVEVNGEYARFEVSANAGTPETATATTYVREDRTVEREIAGERRRLGAVEPITISGQSTLIVVVPPGGVGVGDRDDEDPECSPTWPEVGNVSDGDGRCGGSLGARSATVSVPDPVGGVKL